jgi:hypothetical protein
MKIFSYLFLIATSSILFLASCQKEDIDDVKPEINPDMFESAFPSSCDTLYFGETFIFEALFRDNRELGSFSLEIHDNFDHHAHSTEIANCEFHADKEAVNPYKLIEEFEIPGGRIEYVSLVEMTIPTGDAQGNYDEGDYHFLIRLTDREGWSTQKGLSIKILHRNDQVS